METTERGDKAERIINLLLLLLNTRRPLTVSEIRERIPAYDELSEDAFHRKFERDKDDLRELGFGLDPEDTDAFGGEVGYRIHAEEAQLGDIGLTPAEQAALSLAAHAWGSGRDAGDAALAMLKLAAVSGAGDDPRPSWLVPRVAVDPNVSRMMDAIGRRKRVRFGYRTGGGGEPQQRTIDPYGMRWHNGAWYVGGFDHDRGDIRVFKLSRVQGTIRPGTGSRPDFERPRGFTVEIPSGPWEGEPVVRAVVWFSPDAAWTVERRADPERVGVSEDGWVGYVFDVSDLDRFASWVAGFADAAAVAEPAELRDAVVARMRGVLEAMS